jgi:diguanylate cyclase (GGDEF)-like protein/PAS domain S-box-containing protein
MDMSDVQEKMKAARAQVALFVSNDAFNALDAQLAGLAQQPGTARFTTQMEVCWHLRQRDCARALDMADEIEALLSSVDLPEVEKDVCKGRLLLVRAEVNALFADLSEAEVMIHAAIGLFDGANDAIGRGDARWLLSFVATEQGFEQKSDEALASAMQDFATIGNEIRFEVTHARRIAMAMFDDVNQTTLQIAQSFPETSQYVDPVAAWLNASRAYAAALTDDPTGGIKYFLHSYELALNTGQLRLAQVCAANTAEAFAMLGDLDSALEWSEIALSLARKSRWPGSIGVCLMQAGDVLRLLGRQDEARIFLREALDLMEPLAGSRNYALVLANLGQLALDSGHHQEAFDWFLREETSLGINTDADLLLKAWRGQANALSRLKRPEDAQSRVKDSLALALKSNNAEEQIKALCVLAELHTDHDLAAPEGMTAPTPSLHFLKQAIAMGESITGYTVPADLLQQCASAYAKCNEFRAAYEYSQTANAVRNGMSSADARKRVLAMTIRREMDLSRADIEHHKRLSETLQETLGTLETLGTIGREITASLDVNAIFEALYRHINGLLDAYSFFLCIADEKGEVLTLAFGIENGIKVPTMQWRIAESKSNVARCAREKREIVSGWENTTLIPSTQPTQTMLFAPMIAANRLIGVMSIQSLQANAYGERERSIFRTVCAYGAIALDNAVAYTAVETARRKSALHEQELRVAATAFESQEGMIITDPKNKILRINSAFTRITGFSAEQVVGQSPNLLRSSRHDEKFYRDIDQTLISSGTWQGEVWALHQNGEALPLWLTITVVRNNDGEVEHHVFNLVDITERKMAEDEIRHLAYYDPLTNLPNRRLLLDRLRQAVAKSSRNNNAGALLFVDLDNFKQLNDTQGHEIGDILLENVALRILSCVREVDTVARLGGDEFVILLEDLNEDSEHAADNVKSIAIKILESLNQAYLLNGKEHLSTSSIGVCMFKGKNVLVDELLKQADLAMYQAKSAGRNTFRFFDPEMQIAVSARAVMQTDLRHAVTHQQFKLLYQVQVDSEGYSIGVEALVRWIHPERGVVSPLQFIPLAEETGLILPLGQWILETACKQLKQWAGQAETAHLNIAVNISARQFHDPQFVEKVLAVLEQTDINPHRLKLELTESLLLIDVDGVVEKMNALKAAGVNFSLDDFGTGYSSLSYLKRLPLSQLKVDQTFVRDILVDVNDMAIVNAIVTLGKNLGMDVIAEGVETDQQRKSLESCGCSMFQGYFFGRPMPIEDLKLTLRASSLA